MGNIESTPVVEGQEQNSPQENGLAEQSEIQSQETTKPQVESVDQPTRNDAQRASDYETARQIKRLAKQMQSFQSVLDRIQSPQSQSPSTPQNGKPFSREQLLNDPLNTIQQMIDDRANGLMEKNQQELSVREQAAKHQREVREGWKVIESNETFKKDPMGRGRIEDILNEEDENGNTLQEYSKVNPRHAAQLVLKEYVSRFGSGRNASVSKAQMSTTATSQTAGGNRATTEQELETLYKQLSSVPGMAKDPQFMTKMSELLKKYDMETKLKGK